MKSIWITGVALGWGLWSAACLRGELTDPIDRSYEAIIVRNAFGLKEIPPIQPITNATPPVQPPVNIKFTGITSWGGVKKAYFMIPDTAKPGVFLYPSLREGERDGALEVIEINEKTSTVKVRNADKELVLDFRTHGNNNPGQVAAIPGPQAAGAPGGPPGAPGAPGGPAGVAGFPKPNTPGMFPGAVGQPSNMPQAPSVPSFTPQNTLNFPPTTGLSLPTPTENRMPTTPFPTRTVRAQASLPQIPTHSVEESAAKLMIQNQVAQPLIESGEMPPMPPIE